MVNLMCDAKKNMQYFRLIFVFCMTFGDYFINGTDIAYLNYGNPWLSPLWLYSILLGIVKSIVFIFLLILASIFMKRVFYWNTNTCKATELLIYIVFSAGLLVRGLLRLTCLISPIFYIFDMYLFGFIVGIPCAIVFNAIWEKWYSIHCLALYKKRRLLHIMCLIISAVGAIATVLM